MSETGKWFAVYTKPRWEKKVAGMLARERFTAYCPLNRVVKQWADRKKLLYQPLFTSYVFVQINTATDMRKVKCISGVINFVCWLNTPAVIKDEEIETIQRFLKEYANVGLEKADVNVNDVVRITDGPLMEYQGNIVSVAKNKVKINLPTLGYTLVAEVEKSSVQIVKKAII